MSDRRIPLLRVPPRLSGPALLGGSTTRVGFPQSDPADRAAARRALAAALGISEERMAWARQVHGKAVLAVESAGEQGEADALIDTEGRHALLTTVADCCPVLFWQEDGPALAVAHAGWRGLAAGVLPATVEALASRRVEPARIRAWIGPCIGLRHFEVGTEVAERFDPRFVRTGNPRPFVDLRGAATAQLQQSGLVAEKISCCPDDTFARAELYWSYRRDRGIHGRQLAYLLRAL